MPVDPKRTVTIESYTERLRLRLQPVLRLCTFRLFFRRSLGLGTGLGLYLSSKIVRMLRGKLQLISPLVGGRGAKFTFIVPCVCYVT